MPSLANLEGDETFEASYLGEAAEVCQTRISDDELILVKGTKARTASSIILRGPNDFYCDEMERSVHDALCVVKVRKVFLLFTVECPLLTRIVVDILSFNLPYKTRHTIFQPMILIKLSVIV